MNEERKILDMIEKGQITAEEGMNLLEALKSVTPEVEEEVVVEEVEMPRVRKDYKFLKIRVVADDEDTKVRVNIPLKLITAVGGLLPYVTTYIPDDVKDNLDDRGINLSKIPISEIVESLVAGDLDDPMIVDIEASDGDDAVKVQIYVD